MNQVSMIAVRALAAAVEGRGVARERFLAEAGLKASQIAEVDGRVSLEAYARIRRAALETSGDPGLGLQLGGGSSTGRFDVLGSLVESSSCLREALQLAARYAPIFVEGHPLELHELRDTATIRCSQLSGEAPEVRLTSEFVVSSLLHLVRHFVGDAAEVQRACFAYEAPAHRAEYTRVFAGRESFGHDFTGLVIDRAWLDLPHTYRSIELHELLQKRAELLLARIDRTAPVAERVRRCLVSESWETRPTMSTVARALGMSSRSLRRRLASEDVHYDELAEQARASFAKRMLTDPQQSVQAAAYALGFGTPAAFSRAFRRWTGMAPSQYRKRL